MGGPFCELSLFIREKVLEKALVEWAEILSGFAEGGCAVSEEVWEGTYKEWLRGKMEELSAFPLKKSPGIVVE